MSMNFAREQSLLRQKLQAKASPELAAASALAHGGTLTFLGATDADVAAAAATLASTYPAMGRAQMTAFVRTLWSSKFCELRSVGVQLLAGRAALLEPADLPLLEGFLQDHAPEPVLQQLAREVIGTLVAKNKKLWKDCNRYASGAHEGLRRAGVRATGLALASDAEAFPRFVELVTPLLAIADVALQTAIDDVLVAALELHGDAVRAFLQQHNRSVVLPKQKPKPKVTPVTAPVTATTPPPAPLARAVVEVQRTAKKPVAKATAKAAPVVKAKAAKPVTQKPPEKKPAAKSKSAK